MTDSSTRTPPRWLPDQLNVASLVALTAAFLPAMIARDSGAVVNIASTAAFQPVPTMAVYGATETAFFDNTGKKFLTTGRQTAAQVARVALRALHTSSPTVVSGLSNRLSATGYRFLPRSLMIRLSANLVKEAA